MKIKKHKLDVVYYKNSNIGTISFEAEGEPEAIAELNTAINELLKTINK
jgi:hypothetical protein